MYDHDLRQLELIMCQKTGLTPLPRYILTARSRGSSSVMSGQYPPNTRIPTESELVETYEVARSTARRAVKALRDEGLVHTVPQRGTYVAEQLSSTQEDP